MKLSTIAVDDLAGAVAGLVTRTHALPPGTVLHVNHPIPTLLRTMIDAIVRNTGLRWTNRHTSHEQARKEIRATGGSERHLARICTDHWYTSERIWQLTNRNPGASFAETFPRYAPWYRTELSKHEKQLP